MVILPLVGPILGVISLAMLGIAYWKISEEKKRRDIWKNYLMFLVLLSVAFVFLVLSIDIIEGLNIENIVKIDVIEKDILEKLYKVLGMIILGYISMVAGFYFYRKSLNALSEVTKIPLFSAVGTWYFIGSILTIVFATGVYIILLSTALLAGAFYILSKEE